MPFVNKVREIIIHFLKLAKLYHKTLIFPKLIQSSLKYLL